MADSTELKSIYARRFEADREFRNEMWRVLCRDFFQRYVPGDAAVLELGAGYCEFINSIQAGRRIAVDLNPDAAAHAAAGVEVLASPSTDLSSVEEGSIDRVFASNFFEHLSREDISTTLRQARRILRPEGRILILQPSIRYASRDYWMFFDHVTPLDHHSLAEALEINGFQVVECIPRFLPFTTQGRLPKSVALLRLYLRIPLLWRFFGGQCFLVARPSDLAAGQSRLKPPGEGG